MKILAIDPGTSKCGIAVLSRSFCLYKGIVRKEALKSEVNRILKEFSPEKIIIGNGTASRDIVAIFNDIQDMEIVLVDEKNSTLEARRLYFKENPPRGIWKLFPISLLTPNRDYDDYVAVIIGKRYFDNYA